MLSGATYNPPMAFAAFLLFLEPSTSTISVVHGVIAAAVASKLTCGHEWIAVDVVCVVRGHRLEST